MAESVAGGDYNSAASSIPHRFKDSYVPTTTSVNTSDLPLPAPSSGGVLDDDGRSDSETCRTSDATSCYSRNSDPDKVSRRPLRIPLLPRAAPTTSSRAGAIVGSKCGPSGIDSSYGRHGDSEQPVPFERPFCFDVIIVSSRFSWKRHVFADLRPYICPDLDCQWTRQGFERPQQWAGHVRWYQLPPFKRYLAPSTGPITCPSTPSPVPTCTWPHSYP